MHIICLTPLDEGVYNDHASDNITAPPDGWACIPDDFLLPSTFPRLGSIEAEEKTYIREVEVKREVTKTRDDGKEYTETEFVTELWEYTMMTVVSMTEGTLPKPESDPEQPSESTVWDELDAAYQEGVNSV